MLAMLKFSNVMLGWSAEFALCITLTLALIHTLVSGIKGVVVLDMLHFSAGTISTILLAVLVLVQVGGPTELSLKLAASTDAPMGITDMHSVWHRSGRCESHRRVFGPNRAILAAIRYRILAGRSTAEGAVLCLRL